MTFRLNNQEHNPQTGLLNPGGSTTRFTPATPQNNSQKVIWGVLITPGVFFTRFAIHAGETTQSICGVIKPPEISKPFAVVPKNKVVWKRPGPYILEFVGGCGGGV